MNLRQENPTGYLTKLSLTIKTDDVTSGRKDVDPHGRLRAISGCTWGPKLLCIVRKSEIKHWFSCTAAGRSTVGVRLRDYQTFSDEWIFLAMGLRSRARVAPLS